MGLWLTAVVAALAVIAALVNLPGQRESAEPGESTDPTIVHGSEPDNAKLIGGATGQAIAANFPLDPTSDQVSPHLWWRWTAPESATVRFTTVGSEIDTAIVVRESAPDGPVVAQGKEAGDLATAETSFAAEQGTDYYIEVISEEPAPEDGLVVLSWDTQLSLMQEPSTDPYFTAPEIPLVGTTGEKPQSKLWDAAGSSWAVLASASTSPAGTWVWRQTPQGWAAVTLLSSRTDVRADVLPTDQVVHVLLHGPETTLVSLTHDASTNTYVPWAERPVATVVSLPGSETATIDLDGTGRMWLATETSSEIQMRWADAPYSSFSSPITIASGIGGDDISVVTAIQGGIGVLWSDQSARRFGFRTHSDGSTPETWSALQQPGGAGTGQGGGIADDHLNVAVAADGTLYAAVKTSYDTDGSTVIGLLVRRPNGSWEPLRTVDTRGTRPIVLINEATAMLRVVYTQSEQLDNIIEKATTLAALDFSKPAQTVLSGKYNNATSVKRNSSGTVLMMAGGQTQTGTQRLQWLPPGAPVASDSSLMTSVGTRLDASLSVAGTVQEVDVIEAPTHGTLNLTGGAGFAYTPEAAFTGLDSFAFRARVGTLWSGTARVTIGVSDRGALLGSWDLDEGVGTTVGDSSVWRNHGTASGAATWVDGIQGGALRFDGASGKVTIPNAPVYDTIQRLTVAAWVRPEQLATQYVVKKADSDIVDGFELSLSSSGYPFLRFNRASSADGYRLTGPSVAVADGTRWTHLVGTYDGTTMRLYVDGRQVASRPGPAAIGRNSLPLLFGAQPMGSGSLRGAVDGVRVYSSALTAAEVSALFGQGTPETPPTATPTATATAQPSPTLTPTPSPTPGVPQDAPMGAWAFEEASGSVINDASGRANHGTLNTGVQRINGVSGGRALDFNGTTGRVTIPNNASLNPSNALTIATWVRADRIATQSLIKKSTNSGTDGYELSLASNGRPFFRLNQATSGNGYRVDAPTALPSNGTTWTHLVGTYDGTTMQLFVNGSQVSNVTGPPTITTNGLALTLGDQPGGGYPLDGALDDVRIYDRALSPTDITALFTGNLPIPQPTPTPTPTPTATPTGTSTATPTGTPTATPTVPPTGTPTGTPTATPTAPPTGTPTATVTTNPIATSTAQPSPTATATPSPTPRVPQDAPLGAWTFDDATGSVVTDTSGQGNHGTLTGGVQRIDGVSGRALDFNGTTGRVTIPNNASLNPSNALTIATWVRADRIATQNLVKKSTNDGINGYELSLASSGRPFFRINQATSGNTFRTDALAAIPSNGTRWVHLVGTYDGTTMRLYVDGTQVSSVAGPNAVATNGLTLTLGDQPGGGYALDGALDDVRIYSRALSSTDVTALFTGNLPQPTPTP